MSAAPAGVVLTNALVVDPAAGKLLDGLQTVVIRDGKVVAVYPVDEPDLLAEESSLRRVDVGGRYLSPGLIDGHVHVTAIPGTRNVKEMCETPVEAISYRTTYVLREMLMRGFTTVRDTGQYIHWRAFCPETGSSVPTNTYRATPQAGRTSTWPRRSTRACSPDPDSSSVAKPSPRPGDTVTLRHPRVAESRGVAADTRSCSRGLRTASHRSSKRREKKSKLEQSEQSCSRHSLTSGKG